MPQKSGSLFLEEHLISPPEVSMNGPGLPGPFFQAIIKSLVRFDQDPGPSVNRFQGCGLRKMESIDCPAFEKEAPFCVGQKVFYEEAFDVSDRRFLE